MLLLEERRAALPERVAVIEPRPPSERPMRYSDVCARVAMMGGAGRARGADPRPKVGIRGD